MRSESTSDREAVLAACDELDAAFDKVLGLSFDAMTDAEKLALQNRMERNLRRAPAVEHRLVSSLAAEADPKALGATSLADVLSTRLRISKDEARRRIRHAELFGPRRAFTGQPLAPKFPNTAAAQARGDIGAEHVRIICKFFDDLPDSVDPQTRELAEADLARIAAGFKPEELRQAAGRLAYLLNQDGQFSDVDRARKRSLTIGKQGADGLSKITGLVDPETRATLDAVLAKWAAPGMCNADDESPCVDGEPTEQATQTDTRSPSQRNHDALKAMGRSVLASGELGTHNGLPATVIVTTTLQELESGTGHGVTAGGTLLPMRDVIRLARHSHHYLYIYDKHTREPLYLGRTKRLASAAQRIVLYATERGCTRPGCTAPAYWCQVHHAEEDWADGGQSNITDETLACGPDNRLIEKAGWKTRKRKDGRTEWIPPPHLDTGQTRVNDYHHPERYLLPEEDDPAAD